RLRVGPPARPKRTGVTPGCSAGPASSALHDGAQNDGQGRKQAVSIVRGIAERPHPASRKPGRTEDANAGGRISFIFLPSAAGPLQADLFWKIVGPAGESERRVGPCRRRGAGLEE